MSENINIPLSIYRVKDTIKNKLEDPIKSEKLSSTTDGEKDVEVIDASAALGFGAILYKVNPKHSQPEWVRFLQSGIPNLGIIGDSVTTGALLMLEIEGNGYALTFGTGRFLLDGSYLVDKFGLIVALNCCYPKSTSSNKDYERIKNIRSKTISDNVIRTWKQSARYSTFEIFGVDIQRDLLQSITGIQSVNDKWGRSITGSSSLRINTSTSFEALKKLITDIEVIYKKDDYKENFEWIDKFKIVTEKATIESLTIALFEKVQSKDIDDISLSPPEMINWDEFSSCSYKSLDNSEKFTDVSFKDYYDLLSEKEDLENINKDDFIKLLQKHRLEITYSDNQDMGKWSIYQCINIELILKQNTYVMEGGDFYHVSQDFMEKLDLFINGISESTVIMPGTGPDPLPDDKKYTEDEYNKLAAEKYKNIILLDKKTVKIDTNTSPIEICDLFSDDRKLIHVKRKLSSSSLSHLFNQGFVSSELFQMSEEYRLKTIKKVKAEESVNSSTIPAGTFSDLIPVGGFDTRQYEIVYAIIANWKGRDIQEALPFFSKVSLRHVTNNLKKMGYKVSYLRIQSKNP